MFELTLYSFLFLFLNIPLFPVARPAASDNSETFKQRMDQACLNKDFKSLNELIKANRLKVKPYLDNAITELIKLDLQGNTEETGNRYKSCFYVARFFREIYNEKSLEIAVSYLGLWDRNQKRQKLLADSLSGQATKMRGQKDTREQAMPLYEQSLKIYRDIGDQRGEATVLGGISVLYYYQKDPEQMQAYLQKALELRIACDDKQLIGNSYNDLGSVIYWYFYRDYENALQNLKKSEKIRREIGDHINTAKTLVRIGAVYEDMGKLNEAFNSYLSASEIYQTAGDKNRQTAALKNCGAVKKKLGQYQAALMYLDHALQEAESIGDQKVIAGVLNERGHLCRTLGEYELAYDNYAKMYTVMQTAEDESGLANALNNMGLLLGSMGRHEQAIENYQKSLEIYRKIQDPDGVLIELSNIGMGYDELRRYEQAENYYLQALHLCNETKNRDVEINTLINLGNTLNRQGKLEQAMDYFRQSRQPAGELNNPDQVWRILLGMGDNYERRNVYETALTYYDQAMEILEGLRSSVSSSQYKASFFAQTRYIYDAIVHLLLKMHRKDEEKGYDRRAFQYAERAKARAFLDLMTESLASVRRGVDPDLLNRQENVLREISELDRELNKAETSGIVSEDSLAGIKNRLQQAKQAYQEVQNELRRKNPQFADLTYPQPLGLDDVQALIPDEQTVILNYFTGDSSSALWVIRKERYKVFILPGREDLQESIEIMRFALSSPDTASIHSLQSASDHLSALLLEPARDFIKKDDELVIIPDGLLTYIPFEILSIKNPILSDRNQMEKPPYLIATNPVSYAPSASIWAGIVANRKKRPVVFSTSLLAFGDPSFGDVKYAPAGENQAGTGGVRTGAGGTLQRLEFSAKEVEDISDLFDESDRKYFLGEEANERNVKANTGDEYRYIHFATHGLINERQPDFSALVFSQENDLSEDGLLQAAEIFNLHLRTDLVVLSACQTGLGKMVRGEGIVGLSRAFIYAGAPSVVVSLWRVSDRSTAVLMKYFYTNLIRKGFSKSQALRQAQLQMITKEQYSHPFYWAPFILIGDYQSL